MPASDGDAVVDAVVDGLGDVVQQGLLLSLEEPCDSFIFIGIIIYSIVIIIIISISLSELLLLVLL